MQLKGFVGPTYTLQSLSVNAQRTVNLYPQLDESGTGKNVAALLGTPGLVQFAVLDPDHPARGGIVTAKGRVFVVTYNTLWEVMADGTTTNRGALNSSAGFVGMADNGLVLMLVDGPNGYQYDLSSNALTTLPDFQSGGGGSTVTFQDGFFIFNQPGTQKFTITDAYATTIDWSNFASAESNPDDLLVVLSDHEYVWMFGTNSTEAWYNSGDALFPFTRVAGGVIQIGLAAVRTPARVANTLGFVGRSEQGQGVAYLLNGLTPQRVSTHSVEQAWAKYSTIADASSYTYQQDGHEFWVINFTAGNATWVYDVTTQLWHERAYTGDTGLLERQRGEIHLEAFGKHLVSDYATGVLYVLDRFVLNDAGRKITRIRTAPYESDELKPIFFSRLWLDMETGLGADGTPIGNPAPQCMLQFSDDGAKTWSNELWASMGAIGETLKRVIWWRLGYGRQRVFRLTITDDCKVAINDAFIDAVEGQY